MKKILILPLLVLSLSAEDSLTEHIDSIVEVISQPRVTVEKQAVNALRDPFRTPRAPARVAPVQKPVTPSYERAQFTIDAIINNRAKINNTWVSQGEMINGFTLEEVGSNYAKLTYQNIYSRVLYLNRANNILLKGRSNEN